MRSFDYIALKRNGDRLTGQIDAMSTQDVLEQLHKVGHLPIEVVEASKGQKTLSANIEGWFTQKPTRGQITLLTREVAMLLDAGLPLDRSLRLLQRDTENSRVGKLIREVLDRIVDGKSLHEALAAYPTVFPPAYTNMVRIGEASGSLPTILKRIAAARERDQKLRSKALSAILYPSILLLVAFGGVSSRVQAKQLQRRAQALNLYFGCLRSGGSQVSDHSGSYQAHKKNKDDHHNKQFHESVPTLPVSLTAGIA